MAFSRLCLRFWLGLIVAWLAAVGGSDARADPPVGDRGGIDFFESRIRPVLVEHCYSCHNSAETAESGLALDFREGLRSGGDGGVLVVPGDAAKSRLIAILKHQIDGLEMPEDDAKLDDRVIADFEKWIQVGAPDPRDEPPTLEALSDATSWEATLKRRLQWWSFQPIRSSEPPAVNEWSDHPIDRFVSAKLGEVELSPAAPAEPAILIRRLFINLIGLPPQPGEVETWQQRYEVAGQPGRDDVTEELVDHLLASRHFGERWARHWMDWIRYAESHGSEGDPRIDNAWMYRDYLIRALNADVPYDQLVREHVAGDLISDPRVNRELGINESMIGPAHLRMVFHGFAPTDALDEKVRFVDDQINAFSKSFLGLTVSCARCHDHKFDAISQADYYALFGIFGSCRPARSVIDLPERQNSGRDQLRQLKPKIRQAIAADWLKVIDSLGERILAEDSSGKDAKKPDQVLNLFFRVREFTNAGIDFSVAWKEAVRTGKDWRKPPNQDGLVQAWNLAQPDDYAQWSASGIGLPDRPHRAGEFAVAIGGDAAITGIYPAGVYSHTLSAKDPARLTSGDVDVGEDYELWVRAIGGGNSSLRYVVQDYPRNGTVYPVTTLQSQWKWQRYDLSYWKGDKIHVELTAGKDAPLLVKGDERSWFGVTEAKLIRKGTPPPRNDSEHIDVLLAAAGEATPTSIDDLADLYVTAFRRAIEDWRADKLSDAQAEFLDAGMRQGLLPQSTASLPEAKRLIEEYRRVESGVLSPTRVPGLEETTGRTQRLFVRGNHKQPSEIVPRRFLEAIDAEPYTTSDSGRLQLAEDLLREDNPLTRRVIVNRIWHHLFGRGIVATPDNFGRLGSQPTHPELLDFLATRFARDGWSMKKMIRLVVTSKTWQLDSGASPEARKRDPENLYLSHANVRRMEAEVIRDALLSVSGRLDRTSFGSPVDGNSPRRSVYVQVIRNSLDPFLRVFDFPEPFSSTGRRDVTNVPAQSLTMMNDPRITQYASALAAAILDGEQLRSDDSRIERLFVAGLSRRPSPVELEKARQYLIDTKQWHVQLDEKVRILNSEIAQREKRVAAIVEPVRERLMQQAKSKSAAGESNLPKPIARWEFEGDYSDVIGGANAVAKAGVSIESGKLVVGGGSYAVTSPLEYSLKEKTLEAWVKLDNLNQRGGGVITVQTPDGVYFDSIVFGERDPKQWMAGSNGFARTESFNAPQESEATQRFVHVAIAYHADGRIVGYRDGKPYGQDYKSNGPYEFKAGGVVVSFGVRHLPPSGNRLLAGRIDRAQLYDRALSAEEITATASGSGVYVSESEVLAALSDQDRQELDVAKREMELLRAGLEDLGEVPKSFGERELWTDLARAMFTFKEFIYVR